MDGRMLMIAFPGGNYGADSPLLYYARIAFESRGYETAAIQYTGQKKKAESLQAFILDNQQSVTEQLHALNLTTFDYIVFVSKSLGTVFAGWAEDMLGIRVRHLFMTPLKETLPYIHKGREVAAVVTGTNDPVLDAATLKSHCAKESVHLVQFGGADHRLEAAGDMEKNIDILRAVTALYLECADCPAMR